MPSWSSTEEGISAYFVLFSALLALVLVLSKLLHDRPVLSSVLPEAGMILLVGMAAGFFVNLFTPENTTSDEENSVAEGLLSFSPEAFFVFLLPPIIFNSGYHLRRELFFRHITPIALLAMIGTTVSALTVAGFLQIVTNFGYTGDFVPRTTELLTFGALISATDPVSTLAVFQMKKVDPQLFYLVFGESVLNDAVGLVLFKAFAHFVEKDNGAGKIVIGVGEFITSFLFASVGSPVLGLLCGCGAAYLFKLIDMRRNKLIELSVYIMIMYAPFLLAEVLQLSGIVTILFTGMSARVYVEPNLSQETAYHAKIFFRLCAHLAETSIFLELGMSVFGLVVDSFKGRFILWAILACLVARALNVYPVVFLFNKWLRERSPYDTEREETRSQHFRMPQHQAHVDMSDALHSVDTPPSVPSFGDYPIRSIDTMATETPQFRKDLKIGSATAHMLWFSGLRGAVAYACVRSFPDTFGHQREFVVTTMVIILATVFGLGSTTELMLSYLQIESNVDEDKYMENWHRERRSASLILRFEEFVQRNVIRREELLDEVSEDEESSQDKASPRVLQHPYDAHVEMTASDHFDRITKKQKKESLFDYGGKS